MLKLAFSSAMQLVGHKMGTWHLFMHIEGENVFHTFGKTHLFKNFQYTPSKTHLFASQHNPNSINHSILYNFNSTKQAFLSPVLGGKGGVKHSSEYILRVLGKKNSQTTSSAHLPV